MAHTCANYSLNHLVRLLSTPAMTFSNESKIPVIKLKLGLLKTFRWWMAKRCQENGNLEGVLLQIEVVARNAVSQLQSIVARNAVSHLQSILSDDIAEEWSPKVLLHLQLLKPEIEKAYVEVAQSSPPMPDTLVMEFINFLIDNLKDLLSYLDPSTFAAGEELKALVTKLRFLRNLLRFAATRCTNNEKLKDLSNLAEVRAVEAACLSFMCSFDPIKEDIKEKLAELLQKIKPTTPETREIYVGVLEALSPLTTEGHISDLDLASFIDTLQDCLTEIQDDQPSWMASLKVCFEDLNWELTFLSSFVQDRPMKSIGTDKPDDSIRLLLRELRNWSGTFNAAHLTLKGQFTHIQDLAVKVGGTITQIQDLAVKVGGTIFFYFYVQEMAEHELAEREASLVGFLKKIELLKSEIGVPTLTLPEVNIVRIDDLGFIASLSRNLKDLLHRQAGPVKRRIQVIADELQFLTSFLKNNGERRHEYEELRNLATRIVTVAYRAEYVIDSLLVGDGTPFYHLLRLIDIVVEMKRIRREVMGFDDKKSYLTEPKAVDCIRPSRDTKSVTMLADVNDQVVVGLEDDIDRLRSQLLGGSEQLTVIPIVGIAGLGKTTLARKLFNDREIGSHFNCRSFIEVPQAHELGQLGLNQILRDVTFTREECLRDSVFLIVVDDMWDTAGWDELLRLLPDSCHGSRILVTTPFQKVASHTARSDVVHNLRFLTSEESWELFQKSIFSGNSCPPEMQGVAMEIVNKCKGVPLKIVLVAGILARTRESVDCWRQVLESIPIAKFEDVDSIIDLSFQNLPDYLRQCFLYLGTFPSVEDIPVCKLIRLWSAEGFIQHTEDKSFEDVAMDYLMDLIVRNLVTVWRRSSAGMVKSCKIHNSLHQFCLYKAKYANLFQLMERHDQFSACEHRRLCISSNWGDNNSLKVSGPFVRSLALPTDGSSFPRYNVSSLLQNFKLLRVLDLGGINVGSDFPVGLEKMTLLKYLEVRGEMTRIPPSISSLLQLETFVIVGLSGEVAIPASIWRLTNLRHLNINDGAFFDSPDNKQENSGKLPNLRTMSTLMVSYRENGDEILKRLPRLEKLKCIFLRRDTLFSRARSFFSYFPSNLRRLTLSKFQLSSKGISVIGELPNLEVLKLLNIAFPNIIFICGGWEVKDEQFPRLKFLKLDTVDLWKWNIPGYAFPNLERLELRECKELEEIPFILHKVRTLRVIEVKLCSKSVGASALRIQQERQDKGIDWVKVIIHENDRCHKGINRVNVTIHENDRTLRFWE